MNFSTIVNKGLTLRMTFATLVILFPSIERFGFLPIPLFKTDTVITLYVAPVWAMHLLFHLKPVLIESSFKK
jgi:hypothetical protein